MCKFSHAGPHSLPVLQPQWRPRCDVMVNATDSSCAHAYSAGRCIAPGQMEQLWDQRMPGQLDGWSIGEIKVVWSNRFKVKQHEEQCERRHQASKESYLKLIRVRACANRSVKEVLKLIFCMVQPWFSHQAQFQQQAAVWSKDLTMLPF